MKNISKMRGFWWVRLYGPDGTLKEEKKGENVITTVGKEYIASYLNDSVTVPVTFNMRYVGIGSGTTGESIADIALEDELSRQSGNVSYITGAIYRVTATFATGSGTGAISEYAVFDSALAGTILNRDTELVLNKGADDVLTVICDLTFS